MAPRRQQKGIRPDRYPSRCEHKPTWATQDIAFICYVLSLNICPRINFKEEGGKKKLFFLFYGTSSLSIHEMQLVCQWRDTHRVIIIPHHIHQNTYICAGSCHAVSGCASESARRVTRVCSPTASSGFSMWLRFLKTITKKARQQHDFARGRNP